MNVLIIGDSQAGNPGAAAKRELEARGHTVTHIYHSGQSPAVYANKSGALWPEYARNAAGKDVVLLIFGHNPARSLETSLTTLKRDVHPPVLLSGPPMYTTADDQAEGAAIRDINMRVFPGNRFIDAWPSTPVSIPRASPGNPHFTLAGAAGWGRAMADGVEQFLASPGAAAAAPGGGGGGGTALGPPVGAGRLALAAAGAVAVLGLLWWLSQRPVRRNRRRRYRSG
jgi:hypothetical protein